jgi:hypothetical protein
MLPAFRLRRKFSKSNIGHSPSLNASTVSRLQAMSRLGHGRRRRL